MYNASITIKPDGTVSRSQLNHKDVEHDLMNISKLELIAFNQTVRKKELFIMKKWQNQLKNQDKKWVIQTV